jgi:glycosyltransferase involved in cell wall biosynthesis
MEDGVTGFIVEAIDDAVEATRAIGTLDRRACRDVFDQRFTADRMARDYVDVYETLSDDVEPPQTRQSARVA